MDMAVWPTGGSSVSLSLMPSFFEVDFQIFASHEREEFLHGIRSLGLEVSVSRLTVLQLF